MLYGKEEISVGPFTFVCVFPLFLQRCLCQHTIVDDILTVEYPWPVVPLQP